MNTINIYVTGVGGQGVGIAAEIILRTLSYAGNKVIGVDTHGLAQRGGTVESFVRVGPSVYSPLIRKNSADLILALERNEALRAIQEYAKPSSRLIYYDTLWSPLNVRLHPGEVADTTKMQISEYAGASNRNIEVVSLKDDSLKDIRMQNMILISYLSKNKIFSPLNVTTDHFIKALSDLFSSSILEENTNILHPK
ncbi:MAG: 2-oxoacid:acceptor oxidoreductase family protein [Oligoflexia bacterium]|nr:2-oxoacid:acceptor oxidoreductase family protein [Oligoflexia bacterium]